MNELLRPEAFAVQWHALTQRQQQAFAQIIDLLQAGVDDLRVHERQKNVHDLPPWMSDRRKSRLAFIDGGRGTSKSTLLYALVRALSGSGRSDSPLSDRLLQLSEQVVLLEPLGMETLDNDTHLMAAILARVAKAVEDRSGRAL